VVGVRGVMILKRPLEPAAETDVASEDAASEDRREGVATEDVERVRLDIVRVRKRGDCRPTDDGVLGLVGSPVTAGLASPSVHCKCKITDLVAHCQTK
jgi:hypothetical protein